MSIALQDVLHKALSGIPPAANVLRSAFLRVYLPGMAVSTPHYMTGFLVFLCFVFWIFFCVLVGLYASSKGRSGISFFVLSLFLTPLIGFIIAAVIQPKLDKVGQLSGTKV